MPNSKSMPAEIPAGKEFLHGDLVIPANASGVVIFAHGSGGSRFNPRNRYVAEVLQKSGIGTLLIDLLTKEEEFDSQATELRFDTPLLAERLLSATEWVEHHHDAGSLPIGFFGISTGSAATLIAALEHGRIAAIVSRGGRPDLADDALSRIAVPTLFIVGGEDSRIVILNLEAYELLPGPKKFEVIPGAGHLFEEPGKLEHVANLSKKWFRSHFTGTAMKSRSAVRMVSV